MREKIELLKQILNGSKQYEFEYGENGMTVLKVSNYYTGESIKLDLYHLDEEMLENIMVEDYEEEY